MLRQKVNGPWCRIHRWPLQTKEKYIRKQMCITMRARGSCRDLLAVFEQNIVPRGLNPNKRQTGPQRERFCSSSHFADEKMIGTFQVKSFRPDCNIIIMLILFLSRWKYCSISINSSVPCPQPYGCGPNRSFVPCPRLKW